MTTVVKIVAEYGVKKPEPQHRYQVQWFDREFYHDWFDSRSYRWRWVAKLNAWVDGGMQPGRFTRVIDTKEDV